MNAKQLIEAATKKSNQTIRAISNELGFAYNEKLEKELEDLANRRGGESVAGSNRSGIFAFSTSSKRDAFMKDVTKLRAKEPSLRMNDYASWKNLDGTMTYSIQVVWDV